VGKGLTLGSAPSDAEWQGLLARAASDLVYAVATTRIYCCAGCPARTPLFQNVSLFASREAAEAAGFRRCKRCWRCKD
jgi:AraC family transcriptional regulator of adaptative response/methylated-DNA-[protein]-cysteine methyltransferase